MGKKLVSGPILTHVPEIWVAKIFFSKIWVRQSLDTMVSYHHALYQKKLMIQSWENLVTDGRMNKRTRVISYDAARLTSSVRNGVNFVR